MGGRGAKSRIVGMPKNKKKSIETYNKRIKGHEEKIKKALSGKNNSDQQYIHHWEKEIMTFKNNIEKIERKYRK